MVLARFTRHSCLAVLWFGLATAAHPAGSSAQKVPARLRDVQFWKLVSDFSEPTGTFPSENFLSNESGYQLVIPSLLRATKPGGAYLGVGPEQNFTYIAALRPRIAFIVDIRRQAVMQHLLYKAVFELSKNRAEFLSLLFARPRPRSLDKNAAPQALFAAYDSVAVDSVAFRRNLTRLTDRLTKHHGFLLGAEDLQTIQHVYEVIAREGPHLNYGSGYRRSENIGATPSRSMQLVRVTGSRSDSFCTYVDGVAIARSCIAAVSLTPVPSAVSGNLVSIRSRTDYTALMSATDSAGVQRSFLANEDNFGVVRDLQRRNMVIPVVGDFAGPTALRSVARYLADHHATVAAFYTSNVEQYLFQHGVWQQFYANAAELPITSASRFIRSVSASRLSSLADFLGAVAAGQITTYPQVRAFPTP